MDTHRGGKVRKYKFERNFPDRTKASYIGFAVNK